MHNKQVKYFSTLTQQNGGTRMIAIIDYGMGNLRSVQKAFEFLGYEAVITDSPDVIASASHVILPGVGAFEDAMKRIRETSLDQALMSAAQAGKPVLGICLGMQMMFEYSEENGRFEGLGLFPGTITRLENRGLKIPHMGWNTLNTRDCPLFDANENPACISCTATAWRTCPTSGPSPPAPTARPSPRPSAGEM